MRRGFTLIELMIVIAVLGILLGTFWTPISNLFARLRDGGPAIEEQKAMTQVFQGIRDSLRAVPTFVAVWPDRVDLPRGGRWHRIIRGDFGASVRFENEQGQGVTIAFPGTIRLGPFNRIDDRYVTCEFSRSEPKMAFPIVWRFGR